MATELTAITTPRGEVFKIGSGDNVRVYLLWNPDFVDKWSAKFSEAQKFVDSEVLRLCEPYIPLRTGMLVKSGILGTMIGSGKVSWVAPYARRQYYSPRKPGSETGPLRGPYWFERGKAVWGQKVIDGAKKIMAMERR